MIHIPGKEEGRSSTGHRGIHDPSAAAHALAQTGSSFSTTASGFSMGGRMAASNARPRASIATRRTGWSLLLATQPASEVIGPAQGEGAL